MSLLSSEQISKVTGVFANHFASFSSGINNWVYVYKEPIKQLNIDINSANNLFGYESDQLQQNITYIERSGRFPCHTISRKNITDKSFTELNFSLGTNQILIKVDSTAKNYIINGKTDKVVVNDTIFNINPSFKVQNFFGLNYYYFQLTETQ